MSKAACRFAPSISKGAFNMDDIIFIRDTEHYKELLNIHGKKSRKKFSFKCSICNKETTKCFASIDEKLICGSCKCRMAQLNPAVSEKIKQTKLAKYGSANYCNVEKIKQTKLAKYGDENYCNIEKIKQTKFERYGDENYCNSEKISEAHKTRTKEEKTKIAEKIKQTKLAKYGDENYHNIEQAKKTKLERYGDVNFTNREKYKKTFTERYDCENPMQFNEFVEKHKQTCLNHFGCENPSQADEIKKKKLETCFEHYGAQYFLQTEEGKKKLKEAMLEKCGCEFPLQTDFFKTKRKETCLEKYGVEFFSQSGQFREILKEKFGEAIGWANPQIYEKFKSTMLSRYGCEHPSQSSLIASHKRHKIPYDGLSFDSEPEVRVYKFCKENSIPVKYQPRSFAYTDSLGKDHVYFPDFEISGKLYELKGEHLWKDGHIWFPYRNLLDEKELAAIDARDLAKTECMKANNVRVVFSNELSRFLEKVKQKEQEK